MLSVLVTEFGGKSKGLCPSLGFACLTMLYVFQRSCPLHVVVVRTLHSARILENSDYAFHMMTTKNDSQSFSSGRLGPPGEVSPRPCPLPQAFLDTPDEIYCSLGGTVRSRVL